MSQPACFAGMMTVKQAMQRLTGNSTLGRLAGTRLAGVWRQVKVERDGMGARLPAKPLVRLIVDGAMVRVRPGPQGNRDVAVMVIGVGADGQKILRRKGMASENHRRRCDALQLKTE